MGRLASVPAILPTQMKGPPCWAARRPPLVPAPSSGSSPNPVMPSSHAWNLHNAGSTCTYWPLASYCHLQVVGTCFRPTSAVRAYCRHWKFLMALFQCQHWWYTHSACASEVRNRLLSNNAQETSFTFQDANWIFHSHSPSPSTKQRADKKIPL